MLICAAFSSIKSLLNVNEREMQRGLVEKGSWHEQYNSSPYIFIGGLPKALTEGDIRTVFSQYVPTVALLRGSECRPFWHCLRRPSLPLSRPARHYARARYGQVVDVNLVRDKESGAPKGFAFLAYEQQKSTILAVDNFQGIRLAGSSLRIDHVLKYKSPQEIEAERERRRRERTKYADLISEELFESASGDLMMLPSGFGGLFSPSPSDSSPVEVTAAAEGLTVAAEKGLAMAADQKLAMAECPGADVDDPTACADGGHDDANARLREEARAEKVKRKAERARIREERAKRRRGAGGEASG